MKHIYTKTFSRRTKEDIKSIRRVTSIKKYEVDLNKMWVTYTDIEVMKFKREIKIKEFATAVNQKLQPRKELETVPEEELNSILDKISQSGYDSLTDYEQKRLFKASQKND